MSLIFASELLARCAVSFAQTPTRPERFRSVYSSFGSTTTRELSSRELSFEILYLDISNFQRRNVALVVRFGSFGVIRLGVSFVLN